jgi:hypothetical protein
MLAVVAAADGVVVEVLEDLVVVVQGHRDLVQDFLELIILEEEEEDLAQQQIPVEE